MAKLTFVYGEMACGKTFKLIEDAESTISHGIKNIIVAKPIIDTKKWL